MQTSSPYRIGAFCDFPSCSFPPLRERWLQMFTRATLLVLANVGGISRHFLVIYRDPIDQYIWLKPQ